MPTASYLISDVQTKMGDPSGNIYTSATLLGWLDEAQKDFCLRSMVLRTIDATSVSTGLIRIPLPSDVIMVELLETSRGGIPRKMKRITSTDFFNQQTAVQGVLATDPTLWTELDQNIYVYPRYNGLSVATVLTQAVSAATDIIYVGTTAGFRSRGLIRLRIDSEEIEAAQSSTGSTTASGTFFNLTRGCAQTTAASHSTGATLTQLDLAIVYRRSPQPLATVTASPEIRQIYHEKLELYAMYLCYMMTGERDKAQDMWTLWETACQDAKYSAEREHLGQMGVRDYNSQQITGLYGPA